MISSQEMTNSLYGAYRLARADTSGMTYFDTSIDGFWRSFFAAVLVAPLFVLLISIRFGVDDLEISFFRYYAIESVAYVVGWVLFPLVTLYLVQALEREDQYLGFIVAYNWASVLQNGLYLPFAVLFQLGLISGESAAFLNLVLLGLVLAYTWFIARTALDVSGYVAGGIIILDVGLWISLNVVTESMLRAVP